jgi:hypothetical protein
MIGDPGFHGRSNTQAAMNFAEIVMHEVKSNVVLKVFQLL